MKEFYNRKLGAFELLLIVVGVEFFFGDKAHSLIFGGMAVGFYFAKRRFEGEFSLAQLYGLFKGDKDT